MLCPYSTKWHGLQLGPSKCTCGPLLRLRLSQWYVMCCRRLQLHTVPIPFSSRIHSASSHFFSSRMRFGPVGSIAQDTDVAHSHTSPSSSQSPLPRSTGSPLRAVSILLQFVSLFHLTPLSLAIIIPMRREGERRVSIPQQTEQNVHCFEVLTTLLTSPRLFLVSYFF